MACSWAPRTEASSLLAVHRVILGLALLVLAAVGAEAEGSFASTDPAADERTDLTHVAAVDAALDCHDPRIDLRGVVASRTPTHLGFSILVADRLGVPTCQGAPIIVADVSPAGMRLTRLVVTVLSQSEDGYQGFEFVVRDGAATCATTFYRAGETYDFAVCPAVVEPSPDGYRLELPIVTTARNGATIDLAGRSYIVSAEAWTGSDVEKKVMDGHVAQGLRV